MGNCRGRAWKEREHGGPASWDPSIGRLQLGSLLGGRPAATTPGPTQPGAHTGGGGPRACQRAKTVGGPVVKIAGCLWE